MSNVNIMPANHPMFTRACATVKLECAQGKITAAERDLQLALLEEQREEGTFGQPAKVSGAKSPTSNGKPATFVANPNPRLSIRRPGGESQQEIISKVATGVYSPEEGLAKLNSSAGSDLWAKVSQKGALSVYGLQRMPTTLYKGQWRRLAAWMEGILELIASHEQELTEKSKAGEDAE
jgi:hypothetical protein